MLEDHRKRRIDLTGAPNSPTACKKPMLSAPPCFAPSNIEPSGLAAAERASDDSDHRPTNGHTNPDDQLENFRKEALWRQLQEYKRDLRRAQEKLEQSEAQKTDAEAKLAAIDICWNQLVEDVRLLFKDSGTGLDVSFNSVVICPPSSPTGLDRALQQRSTASKDLILHLISLASSSSLASPDLEEVRSRCRLLTAESAKTRAALGLAESKLKQLQDQLEVAEEAARRAEKKLDRERSRTVRALDAQGQGGSTSRIQKPETNSVASESVQQLADEANGNRAHSPKPRVPALNGVDSGEPDLARELADARSRELDALKGELLRRAHEIDVLQWKVVNLPDGLVHETPAYKCLKAEMAHATVELERVRGLLETAQKDADDLRERQEDFRVSIVSDMTSRLEDMEKKLASKDADLTRIRATREEARSELHELKSRDAEKMKQVAQIRTLANSRQDRINALSSEVRRLKMRLAADAGDRETLDFLAVNDEIDVARGLQQRLKKAQQTIESLQLQIDQVTQSSHSDDLPEFLRSQADAHAKLSLVQERATHLESILGPEDGEVSQMAKRLEAEIDKQKVLEARLVAQEASAAMLYSEVDRLSTAWAALDEQNRDKVFKLAEHDEKVLKAVHEKAKADNRYFSAMRANETLKTQTAVLEKMAEKQTATITKMSDELRAVSSRLTSAEREITTYQKIVEAHKSKITELSVENTDLSTRCSQNEQKMAETLVVLKDRSTQVETEAAAKRAAEENLASLDRELSKLRIKTQTGNSIDSPEVMELKSFNEDLTKMLKCNSCKQRFKSHVITRCMHLFCGACLEARLETRQRKCPTCSTAFGTNDVSPVYF